MRLLNWFLITSTKYPFFEKHIRYQSISFLQKVLFPEFRKKIGLFDFIKKNRLIITILALFILSTSGFFSIGRWISYTEKKEKITYLESKLYKTNDILYYTNSLLHRKDSTISQLREKMGSRDYLQYVIKRDCNLKHYNDLEKLSDKVFFTIIDEIERYKIPYTIFFRVIDHESGFQFIQNSQGSGAFGYCQIIPITFQTISKKLGLTEHNEVNNIKTGAYLLYDGYNRYRVKGFGTKESWYRSLVDYAGGDTELATTEIQYLNKSAN